MGGYSNSFNRGFLIARYNINGSIDSTFGSNGAAPVIKSTFSDAGSHATKVIIKLDGKIVAGGAGYTGTFENFAILAQYLPNGKVDSSFGTNGTTAIGNYFLGGEMDAVNDLALTPDKKMIAVLNEIPMGVTGHTDFAVYKLLPNGDNDSTFGTDGVVQTDIDNVSGDDAYSTVVLPDNTFVVAGYSNKSVYYPATNTSYSATSIALVKYRPNGSLDSTFGVNGKVLTLVLPDSTAYPNHILLSPDGSFIISGYAFNSKEDFVLTKYSSNGKLDSSFGNNGIVFFDFSNNCDISYSSALQADGKIVLAGSTGNSTTYSMALARYTNAFVYPLHLLAFTATKNGKSNLLQWQTAQEINTAGFEVQRSSNGINYNTLGFVNAGTSTYHFVDDKPLTENNYYRLKIVDKDGSFTYSPVREITNSNAFTVTMYPNPVKNKMQVLVNSDKEQIIQWQIVSNEGKLVLSDQWAMQAGSSLQEISVAALAKGTYYLMVITKNKKQVAVKFEKM